MLIPLKSLITFQPQEDGNATDAILSSFSCKIDADLTNFLKKKASTNEMLMRSRTYLLFDDTAIKENGALVISAYFTIALKVLDIPDGLSADEIISLDGQYSKFHHERIKSLPCYLIGQLGRNDSTSRETLEGKRILEEAMRVIKQAHDAAGGRVVLIECKDNDKLAKFYTDNGFEFFRTDTTGNHTMIQMIYRLSDHN